MRHPEYEVGLEEQWFFEAVVSVYTQLLHVMWNLERDKVDFRLTVSLTPPLLSMMQDPHLKLRAARHIDECIKLATRERDNARGKPWLAAAEQLNRATGPTVLVLPLRGVSMIDAPGKPFHDPEADRALFESLRQHLAPSVELVEVDAHINDPVFADTLADRMLQLLGRSAGPVA